MKILKQGAESLIKLENNRILKHRIKKSYRISDLDLKLRRFRTKREAKLLATANVNVPRVLNIDDENNIIEMEYLNGKLLKNIFDNLKEKERLKICKILGEEISKLHAQNIIHGDLTTSNLILKDDKLFFIDFGLGFFSNKVEDKAVDLHLLKQALESKHYKHFKSAYQTILRHYSNKEVLKRLEKVESRGRYKERK